MKILFICKNNESYGSYNKKSSGLINSVKFVVDALPDAHVVQVVDNNCIDRVVTEYKPDTVIIEALWVVPEKFDVLKRLHPNVRWIVRLHSNVPFIANEGIAVEWIRGYEARGVEVAVNSKQALEAYGDLYLPNIYDMQPRDHKAHYNKEHIDIACFGAIRPMKNQLAQAYAAIQFGVEKDMPVRFHINSTRIENRGESIYKNLKALPLHIVEHPWHSHKDFIKLLNKMDIGMQVSLSETFNIVSADYVSSGLPVVVSKEVRWASRLNYADPGSVDSMVRKMHFVWRNKPLVWLNQWYLRRNSCQALAEWLTFILS
jgi:hypothetical protein